MFALAEGKGAEDAVSFAARCGAACLTGEALTGQLRLKGLRAALPES
jgi:sugar/nucleoside kinase (ribokinase family)